MNPTLVCQAFQRAFIDASHPKFSVSATLRRETCSRILERARLAGWSVVHTYLALEGTGGSAIDGFMPSVAEPYFWQPGLSAYDAPGFAQSAYVSPTAPVLLMSLAGLPAIAATLLDGMRRHADIRVISHAVADTAADGVGESEKLLAIDTLARACGRRVDIEDMPEPTTARAPTVFMSALARA
jgi:hypothetical protein